MKKHLDACNRLPVETRDGKNNLLRAILTQCYLPPTYNVEMFRHQICGFMVEFGYFFFPQMEEYLKRKKISYCKYLEKVFNGDIWADEYMLGAVAKMWNIRINVVSPSYKDVWEVFHDEVILMLLSFLMVMTLEKLMESHILRLQEEK